jgi:cytochrome P450
MPAVATPHPLPTRPWERLRSDLRYERQVGPEGFPPGWTSYSMARTREMRDSPLSLLIAGYREFGPIFTLKIFHANFVVMLGPEANHFVTVSNASKFVWRDGGFGDLVPLLGDGLLTIDGGYHRRARRIMLPAFHREQIATSTETMIEEADRALAGWRDGAAFDLYEWTRTLAMRIAMRALFGFDPDHQTRRGTTVAEEFENALSFYAADYYRQTMRTPRSPYQRMQAARKLLDEVVFDEIARRRESGEQRSDILSLLLAASDEDGSKLSDQELRDQIVTLLFAGHDTTTSTITFLLYELARHTSERAALEGEIDSVLGGAAPVAAQLTGADLPQLEMAVEETLRLYPPAWIGPRRAVEDFEFNGHRVAAGAPVSYSSWVSHHLPDVFEDPEEFRPARFTPEGKAAMPKGAYVPFGGGSRTCIGMRFGQMEIRAIAARIVQRWRVEPVPGWTMFIRQMPTLSPRGGMPVVLRAR